jgi:hypothetical protein
MRIDIFFGALLSFIVGYKQGRVVRDVSIPCVQSGGQRGSCWPGREQSGGQRGS